MKKILFVTYGGGHVAAITPVASKMSSLGYDVVILALTTAQTYLTSRNINISCLGFKDLPWSQTEYVQFYGKKLTKNLSNAVISAEESIAYMGLSYTDLIDQCGEESAQRLFETCGRQAFLPVQTLKKVIQWLQPHAVVATNSPRAERAAILAAGEIGIPALCLVDLSAVQEIQWVGKLGYANKICVLNQEVRRRFIAYGRSPEEVVVTGNPAFDSLHSPSMKLAGIALKQKRNWDDGRITLLWASQPEPEQHPFSNLKGDPTLPRRIESELRQFIRHNDCFRLVVRYHPSECVNFIQQERVYFSPVSENLYELLHAIDGVITLTSTVGLEASIIGKLLILVNCSVFTKDALYLKELPSESVNSPEDLSLKLLDLYQRGKFAKERNANRGANTNISSTEKVIYEIESIIGDNS